MPRNWAVLSNEGNPQYTGRDLIIRKVSLTPASGHVRDDIKTKKRPHFWGRNPKEARGRKSGIVVEGAAFAEKAAWVEDSAIPKEEDRTHIACGLFSWCINLHSPGQTRGLWQPSTRPS